MALPNNFRLDHSGGDHREYPRAAAHQIVWTTIPADASPGCRLDDCILAVPSLLEICVAPLFKREFVRPGAGRRTGCSLRLSSAQSAHHRSPEDSGHYTRQDVRLRKYPIFSESSCAVREMFLIKRPFFRRQSIRGRLTTLWLNQRKRRVLQRNQLLVSRDQRARFTPKRPAWSRLRAARRLQDVRRNPDGRLWSRPPCCSG